MKKIILLFCFIFTIAPVYAEKPVYLKCSLQTHINQYGVRTNIPYPEFTYFKIINNKLYDNYNELLPSVFTENKITIDTQEQENDLTILRETFIDRKTGLFRTKTTVLDRKRVLNEAQGIGSCVVDDGSKFNKNLF